MAHDHRGFFRDLHQNGEYEGKRVEVPGNIVPYIADGVAPHSSELGYERLMGTTRGLGDQFDAGFTQKSWREWFDEHEDEITVRWDGDARILRDAQDGRWSYHFKVWLQTNYEEMVQGNRSTKIFVDDTRSADERATEEKWDELTELLWKEFQNLYERNNLKDKDLIHLRDLTAYENAFFGVQASFCPMYWSERTESWVGMDTREKWEARTENEMNWLEWDLEDFAHQFFVRRRQRENPEDLKDFTEGERLQEFLTAITKVNDGSDRFGGMRQKHDATIGVSRRVVKSLISGSRRKNISNPWFFRMVYNDLDRDDLTGWIAENGLEIQDGLSDEDLVEALLDPEKPVPPREEWILPHHKRRRYSIPCIEFVKIVDRELRGYINKLMVDFERQHNFMRDNVKEIGQFIEDIEKYWEAERLSNPDGGYGQSWSDPNMSDAYQHLMDPSFSKENIVVTILRDRIGNQWEQLEQTYYEIFEKGVVGKRGARGRRGRIEKMGGFGGEKRGERGEGVGWSADQRRKFVSEHNILRLSSNIIHLLVDMGWLYMDMGDHGDITDFYGEGEDGIDREIDWTGDAPNMLRFSKKLLDLLEDGEGEEHPIIRTMRHDSKRWMYCEPEEHRHISSVEEWSSRMRDAAGGYLNPRLRASIMNNSLYDRLARMTNDDGKHLFPHRTRMGVEPILALNMLQRTQWEVNLDFLEIVAAALDQDEGESDLPIREQAIRWEKIVFRGWVESCRKRPRDWAKDTRDSMRKWEGWDERLNHVRRAIRNGGNVFWHAWACDSRGRFYPMTTDLSPVGDDLDRALIRFKEWKPLGDQGIRWLRIHVCNLLSGQKWPEECSTSWIEGGPSNKKPFEWRNKWTLKNLKLLREIAQAFNEHKKSGGPEDKYLEVLGLHRRSRSGDECFQRLAALIELNRVYCEFENSNGNWDEISSGQAVYLDASNNGFQHAAMLLRHKKLAKSVNLLEPADVKKDSVEDLYQEVANEAKRAFENTEEKTEFRIMIEEHRGVLKPAEEWAQIFTRRLVKGPTMIATYGAQNLKKCFIGRDGKGKPGFRLLPKLKMGESEKFPYLEMNESGEYCCQVNTKGNWGSGKSEKCKEKFANEREFVKHINSEHGEIWVQKLHPDSLFRDIVCPQDGENMVLEPSIEGEWSNEIEDLLVNLAYKLSADVQKAIKVVTDEAYQKIGRDGLVKIQKRIDLDADIQGDQYERDHLVWNTDGLYDGQGIVIRNLCILQGSKARPSPWKLFDLGGDKREQIIKDMYKFLVDSDVDVGEMPDGLWDVTRDRNNRSHFKHDKKISKVGNRLIKKLGLLLEDTDDEVVTQEGRRLRLRFACNGQTWSLKTIENANHIGHRGKKAEGNNRRKRGITPNFIHSLDAAHMRMVVVNWMNQGHVQEIQSDGGFRFGKECRDIWVVHDCFGAHARDIEKMRTIVKKNFLMLHCTKDLGDRILEIDHLFNIRHIHGAKQFMERHSHLIHQYPEEAMKTYLDMGVDQEEAEKFVVKNQQERVTENHLTCFRESLQGLIIKGDKDGLVREKLIEKLRELQGDDFISEYGEWVLETCTRLLDGEECKEAWFGWIRKEKELRLMMCVVALCNQKTMQKEKLSRAKGDQMKKVHTHIGKMEWLEAAEELIQIKSQTQLKEAIDEYNSISLKTNADLTKDRNALPPSHGILGWENKENGDIELLDPEDAEVDQPLLANSEYNIS